MERPRYSSGSGGDRKHFHVVIASTAADRTIESMQLISEEGVEEVVEELMEEGVEEGVEDGG